MLRDIKADMEELVTNFVEKYQEEHPEKTKFGKPVFGYANTDDDLFDTLLSKGACKHPKQIHRPGLTLIVYYLPCDNALAGSKDAYFDSMWLAMKINAVIRDHLVRWGRIVSQVSTMVDWDFVNHHHVWDNKMAAFVAGMGEFGPGGSFHVGDSYSGRVCSMFVDQKWAEEPEERAAEDFQRIYDKIMTDCCYEGAKDVHCSEEMIAACPGAAISEAGIDRQKCQDYCATLHPSTPCPEVCGQCFKFKG